LVDVLVSGLWASAVAPALPRYKRSARYRRALCGLFPAKDIVVWTPAEMEEWRAVPHAFISTILATGKVVYG
jgi:hypothetical protein